MKHNSPAIIACLVMLFAQTVLADALKKPRAERAADVQKLFTKEPSGYDNLFDETFRKAVPDAQLTALFTTYFHSYGPCTSFQLKEKKNGAAIYDFTFAKGYTAPVTLSVEAEEPHRINGLFIGKAVRRASSFNDILSRLKKLPGTTSFLAQQLDVRPQAKTLASYNEDKALAIRWTFKLYILCELVREIEAGQRHWTDVIALDQASKSLPSGDLQNWPAGSPLTLHTVAAMMISKSDNTAADLLLHTLGRANVEAILKLTGQSSPRKDIPFLSTLEMFKIKYTEGVAEKYLAADVASPHAARRRDCDTGQKSHCPHTITKADRPA